VCQLDGVRSPYSVRARAPNSNDESGVHRQQHLHRVHPWKDVPFCASQGNVGLSVLSRNQLHSRSDRHSPTDSHHRPSVSRKLRFVTVHFTRCHPVRVLPGHLSGVLNVAVPDRRTSTDAPRPTVQLNHQLHRRPKLSRRCANTNDQPRLRVNHAVRCRCDLRFGHAHGNNQQRVRGVPSVRAVTAAAEAVHRVI
jgi:hypothetical protein